MKKKKNFRIRAIHHHGVWKLEASVFVSGNWEILTRQGEYASEKEAQEELRKKVEVTMASKKANCVVRTACKWWANKRPVGWDITKHLENPKINTVGEAERDLSYAVADFLRPMKNPGEWEK